MTMQRLAVAVIATFAASSFAAAAPSATVQSSNETGFRLMQESLKNEKTAKNVLVSPISAHFALSMALNGAAGKTRTEFVTALGYVGQTDVMGVNFENETLLQDLTMKGATDAEKKALTASREKLPPVLSIQNSVWATNGATDKTPYNFKSDFVKAMKTHYGVAKSQSLDFRKAKSADVINAWTSEATNKMIPEIIDADALKDLMWILLNTTYLEGQWTTPFGKPYDEEFTALDGKKSQVKTMTRAGTSQFADTKEYQVAEVEIAKGTLRAFVVLPKDAADFETLQKDSKNGIWTEATWAKILKDVKPMHGRLTMPTFTFDYGVEMKEDTQVTKGMGFNFLFKNSSDFSEMDGQDSVPSKVGIIKQNTKIEWAESGVKAAAATLVGGMMRSSMPRPYDITMIVDRPFYIAIQDSKTGAFLFVGQVVEPK